VGGDVANVLGKETGSIEPNLRFLQFRTIAGVVRSFESALGLRGRLSWGVVETWAEFRCSACFSGLKERPTPPTPAALQCPTQRKSERKRNCAPNGKEIVRQLRSATCLSLA
jgi:hypothetical protein